MRKNTPDFFIIGSAKSGTTWLLESLNYHPDVMCFNELQIMTQIKNGIASLLNTVNSITSDLASTSFMEFQYYTPQFNHKDVDSLVAKVWERVIHTCPKNATIYGEKCPSYADNLEELVLTYPEASYIHIVRDPRDVGISWYYHVLREKRFRDESDNNYGGDLTRPLIFDRPQDSIIMDSITQWKRQQSTVESMKIRFPEKFYTVKYENMSPRKLDEIFKFIGAHSDVDICNQIFELTDIRNKPKTENSFFKFGKSGNWHSLDTELIKYMHSVIGDWLEKYNYPRL